MTAFETLECAKVNFDNFVKMNPHVKAHPIFALAMEQLRNGLAQLEEEEA